MAKKGEQGYRPPRAICVCGFYVALRKDGTFREHKLFGLRCPGVGRSPFELV